MKVTPPHTLARLLSDRLAEGGDAKRAVTLAQLLDDHLAYARVRAELQLAGKGEYDVAVLGLLADRTLLQVDPAIEAAARRELTGAEPGLAFAGPLADRLVRLRGGGPGETDSDAPADEDPRVASDPVEPVAERFVLVDSPSETAEAAGSVARTPEAEPESAVEPEPEPQPAVDLEPEPDPESGALQEPEPESAVQPEPRPAVDPDPEPATDPDPEPVVPAQPELEAAEPTACWGCSESLPERDGIRFCPRCGVDQEAPRCTACGDRLEADWAFCPRCGRALER